MTIKINYSLDYKNQGLLYREIITVCSWIHINQRKACCAQNVESLSVTPGYTKSNYKAFQPEYAVELLQTYFSRISEVLT
jgi:hypothetical protein